MTNRFTFLLLLALSATKAYATDSNTLLAYTMKAIAKDYALVGDPTKKPVGEASDNIVLTAIIRTRTMHALLQTCIDRRETEMVPGKIAETSDVKEKQSLQEQYINILGRAQAKLVEVEKLYFAELAKSVGTRDFAAASRTLKQLESAIGEGHMMFKPPKPPQP